MLPWLRSVRTGLPPSRQAETGRTNRLARRGLRETDRSFARFSVVLVGARSRSPARDRQADRELEADPCVPEYSAGVETGWSERGENPRDAGREPAPLLWLKPRAPTDPAYLRAAARRISGL